MARHAVGLPLEPRPPVEDRQRGGDLDPRQAVVEGQPERPLAVGHQAGDEVVGEPRRGVDHLVHRAVGAQEEEAAEHRSQGPAAVGEPDALEDPLRRRPPRRLGRERRRPCRRAAGRALRRAPRRAARRRPGGSGPPAGRGTPRLRAPVRAASPEPRDPRRGSRRSSRRRRGRAPRRAGRRGTWPRW